MYFFLIKYGNYRSIPTATPLRCKYVPIITGATVFLWNRPVIQIVKALQQHPTKSGSKTQGAGLEGGDTFCIYTISSTPLLKDTLNKLFQLISTTNDSRNTCKFLLLGGLHLVKYTDIRVSNTLASVRRPDSKNNDTPLWQLKTYSIITLSFSNSQRIPD